MDNQLIIKRYKLFSADFLKSYIVTMRPYLMFVSGITGIAGISFLQLSFLQNILIFIASFLSYGFGQALTDCFQTDTDSISSPYRPLTQNVVSKKSFLSISIIGLIFCVSIFSIYNPFNLILGFVAGVGLATYTFFKRRWWGGPFYNAWIVAALFLMAFLTSGKVNFNAGVLFALPAVFFGYSNFVLSGYFKDIEADRETNYKTLPVKFGRHISSLVSDLFAFLMMLFGILSIIQTPHPYGKIISSFAFFIIGILFSVIGQLHLHKVYTDFEAHKAITPVVHSYILILSALVLSYKPGWLIYILIFYSGFLLTMKLRPSKEQI